VTQTVLIAHASIEGQTRRIAERIAAELEDRGIATEIVPAEALSGRDPRNHRAVIAGSSVRYGKHNRRLVGWLERHADALEQMPNAFFSVNLVARKPENRSAGTNSHVAKCLAAMKFTPACVAVFPGKLDYPSWTWWQRLLIRGIMKSTDGPHRGDEVIEYTDWNEVEGFAEAMAERLAR